MPNDDLRPVLMNAVAHGALAITWDYGQGGKKWCLVELTGTAVLAYGLTFDRGGFIPVKERFLREAIADA